MADAKMLRFLGLSLSAVTAVVMFVAAFTVSEASRAPSTASSAIATLVD
jgi:hypothetical protein